MNTADWEKTKTAVPVGADVSGRVVACQPFGVFLDLGIGFLGLPEITEFGDQIASPAVGTLLTARVLQHVEGNQQLRLTQNVLSDEQWRRLKAVAALDKDPAIVVVLDQLWSRLGIDTFVIADYWESDMCAIGVVCPRDPRVLVYISCYGEPHGRYSYELELPSPPGEDSPYIVTARASGVLLEELACVVATHLKHTKQPV